MIYTTLNENGEIIFNENKKETVECPHCNNVIDAINHRGIAYKCPMCHQTFIPNNNKDDEN